MSSLLYIQLSHPYVVTGKTTALTFVREVMTLLFNTLSKFIRAFLQRSRHLLSFMAIVTVPSVLEAKKIKSVVAFSFSLSTYHEVMGLVMILVFGMLNFKLAFSISSFILIKRHFSSSSFSAFRVVLFAYLRLLIFLPAILIPACDAFSLAFHMMYSASKLSHQDENI